MLFPFIYDGVISYISNLYVMNKDRFFVTFITKIYIWNRYPYNCYEIVVINFVFFSFLICDDPHVHITIIVSLCRHTNDESNCYILCC